MRHRARLRAAWRDLLDAFWLRPALMTLGAVALAEALIALEGRVEMPAALAGWVYAGRSAGARDMLGVVAGGAIGVAGTTFSITVAALTLASNQLGPRLLNNFTRDAATQVCLGALVATFAYALVVLRAVRGGEEDTEFVPALAVSVALALALLCTAALIYFLHRTATSINVDRVIALVHEDLSSAVRALPPARGGDGGGGTAREEVEDAIGGDAAPLRAGRRGGYLRALDDPGLADWAARNGAAIRLSVRPGDFLFPGAAVGEARPARLAPEAERALRAAVAVGPLRSVEQDLEFGARQLVEIGLRAMSSGVKDPFTAVAVLDRLGATLCDLARHRLPDGRERRGGRVVLERPATGYAGLLDATLHPMRQAAGEPSVLLRLLEVIAAAAEAERDPARRRELSRHFALAEEAAREAAGGDASRARRGGRAAPRGGRRYSGSIPASRIIRPHSAICARVKSASSEGEDGMPSNPISARRWRYSGRAEARAKAAATAACATGSVRAGA